MQMNRILVNPDGQVWPCCYLCNKSYKAEQLDVVDSWFSRQGDELIKKYLDVKDELNLKNHSMEEIVNHEWYTKTLPESWEKEETRLEQCRMYCEHVVEEDE